MAEFAWFVFWAAWTLTILISAGYGWTLASSTGTVGMSIFGAVSGGAIGAIVGFVPGFVCMALVVVLGAVLSL